MLSLSYECWSSRTMVALVSDFGCFTRADEFTARVADLFGYHFHDIPENLVITFDSISMTVLIHLERCECVEDTGCGNPPSPANERSDRHGLKDQFFNRARQAHSGRSSTGEDTASQDASWCSSKIYDRGRPLVPSFRHNRRFHHLRQGTLSLVVLRSVEPLIHYTPTPLGPQHSFSLFNVTSA